jgi:ABC-2 type transport system permease protein
MTVLLGHTLRANAARALLVALGLAAWGFLMPVVYVTFGAEFKALVQAGLIPQPLLEFLGGNVLTLGGAVALGVVHPISVFLKSLLAVGLALYAVAGERQRGTLEVVLARPIGRRSLHASVLAAVAVFSVATVGAELVGSLAGSVAVGVVGELSPGALTFLWLDGAMLYIALGAISLAASVSFDRLAPAATAALVVIVVSYVLEALAQLWPDARGLGPASIFHYLDARSILAGSARPADLLVLGGVAAAAVAFAQVVFPRRDLAAPA